MPFGIARAGGKVPLPGARSTPSGVARRLTFAKHWLVCITLTRRTTSAVSTANGGKVPLPGAHANAPTGGVRAASTGKASVGLHNHLHYI